MLVLSQVIFDSSFMKKIQRGRDFMRKLLILF